MKALLILAAALALAVPAWADVGPYGVDVTGTTVTSGPNNSGQRMNGCVMRRMCSAQTAATDCVDTTRASDEIVADVAGMYNHTFYGTPSTDAYTCTVVGNAHGHDAESGEAQNISTAGALTETSQVVTLEGSLSRLWVTCSVVTTSVTVDMLTCPMTK